jgi:hypothetical protein
MSNDRIILCEKCGQKNRIAGGINLPNATCGKCGKSLSVSKGRTFSGFGTTIIILCIAFVVIVSQLSRKDSKRPDIKTTNPVKQTQKLEFSASPVQIDTGIIRKPASNNGIAPLKIKVALGNNFFIKVVDLRTENEVQVMFIKGGESINTKVPLGTYVIKYAVGKTWYGEQLRFGPKTSYLKADKNFIFDRQGNKTRGYTVELIVQPHGNLKTSPLDPSNF